MVRGELRYFRDMAEYVKKDFEAKFKGTWHVIVGKYTTLIIIPRIFTLFWDNSY